MAQEKGLRIKLKAMFDKKQVEQETKDVITDAQKIADLQDIKMDLQFDSARYKKQLEDLKKDLRSFKEEGVNSFGATKDKFTELEAETRIKIEQVQDKLKDTQAGIREINKEIDNLEENAREGGGALEDMGKSGNKLADTFKNLAGKITAWALVVKGLSMLKKIFNDFQQAQKTIVQQTGATGTQLKNLTNDMLEVQGKVAQSQGEIAEAVGELNTRLGLNGKELQTFTEKYLKFASVTGQDGKKAIEDNVKMFNAWGVSTREQKDYLDKLVVAGQKTGISVSQLTSQLQDNAPVLQELGFSLDDSITLLSNFEKAGVNVSEALQGMKMGLINFAEEGVSPSEALEEAITGIKDGTIDLNEATQIFGNKGGVELYNAIRNGTIALDDMKGALDDTKGAVESTYKEMETFAEFIERQKNGIIAWNEKGFQSTMTLVEVLGNKLKPTIDKVNEARDDFKDSMTAGVLALKGVIDGEGKFTDLLRKNYLQMEKNKEETRLYNEVIKDLKDSEDKARTALEKFNKTKVDDSKTRAEFEADRVAAINAMNAFIDAYEAKMQYFGQEGKGKGWWDRGGRILAVQRSRNKVRLTRYSPGDGGEVGEDLLGGGGGGSNKSKAEEMLEAFNEELENTWDSLESMIKDHQEIYDDLVKDIKKVEEEYSKLKDKAQDTRDSAEKSIRSYNEQLEKNQTDSIQKLGQRYVELKEQRAQIDNDFLKEKVWNISDKELARIRDEGYDYYGYAYDEIKKIKDIYDEIKLIEENTTEEQRNSEMFTKQISKAQEILNNQKAKELEIEEKKADALEKQGIAQALMNQKLGEKFITTLHKDGEDIGTRYYNVTEEKWTQIHNVDNIEYAKQLEAQGIELDKQYSQLQQEKDKEVQILNEVNAEKIRLEEEYTVVYNKSIENQKKGIDELIAKTEQLIAKKKEYLSLGGESHNAYGGSVLEGKASIVGENGPEQIIARQSSYVQPRNAGNSYNTVNTNNLSINGLEFGDFSTIDDMLEALKEKLTYRS